VGTFINGLFGVAYVGPKPRICAIHYVASAGNRMHTARCSSLIGCSPLSAEDVAVEQAGISGSIATPSREPFGA
jgi:hypothetical protein